MRIIVRRTAAPQNSLWCRHKSKRRATTRRVGEMFDFQLKLADLTFTGTALDRPECVLATAKGDLFTSDARGGVVHIRPDGTQQLITGSIPGGGKLHPNGFAMLRDGSFLLANRGDGREGGVWRLHRNGQVEPFLLEVDGITLPRTNFV